MCGIVALLGGLGTENLLLAEKLLTGLAHRGDSAPRFEVFADSHVLGCARLAIVDRTNIANQPFVDITGRYVIVFNGEIYNHLQLRQELTNCGSIFQTASDTETVLEAYRAWGIDFTEKLNGMFALCILDRFSGEFLVCRDNFGIKPLYMGRKVGTTVFASEIHPLTSNGITNIEVVPPGAVLANHQLRKLFDFKWPPTNFINEREALDRLRQHIRQSVALHANTDLPIAVYCSGGIDSSVLLYELSKLGKCDIFAYCVGTPDASDLAMARRLCEHLHIPLKEVIIRSEDALNEIRNTIRVIESFEPNHIRAGTTSMLLAKQVAADGIKVVICGEGADELFGGYAEFSQLALNGESTQPLHEIFLSELHKTQLQRVDRTTMRYGIEARVPFLEKNLVHFVNTLPQHLKSRPLDGRIIDKWILREAYRGLLPAEICDRRKTPMGEGAGVGDNGPAGIFWEHALQSMPIETWNQIKRDYESYNLDDQEQGLYFKLFLDEFGEVNITRKRPKTNLLPT